MPIMRTDRGLSLGLCCSIIAIVGSLGRDDYEFSVKKVDGFIRV